MMLRARALVILPWALVLHDDPRIIRCGLVHCSIAFDIHGIYQ